MRAWGVLALAVTLGACSGVVPRAEPGMRPAPSRAPRPEPIYAEPSAPALVRPIASGAPIAPLPTVPPPANAASAMQAGIIAGPAVETLPISQPVAAAALAAFKMSCPSLLRRIDTTGLTRGDDWRPACAAAATAQPEDAPRFFATWFETVQVGDGKAFATGYFEPEIEGSLHEQPGYAPIYARPRDLVDVDLGLFSKDLTGKRIRGRVDGTAFVPYFDRTEIEQGALAGRSEVLGWARDPVELFFLQVQGSGRLRLPDGRVIRLGYDSQNGRDYTGIGALMRQRGLLQPGQSSMQGIVQWLHDHPEEGRALMRENKSFVFFKELTGPGPLGALGLPVAGEVSAAADPRFVPLGAPVFLSLDRPEASGLWVAQDTGGAIKGANRFDTFWGAGDRAREVAGGMSARGAAFLLLPKGTLARFRTAQPQSAPPAVRVSPPDE